MHLFKTGVVEAHFHNPGKSPDCKDKDKLNIIDRGKEINSTVTL